MPFRPPQKQVNFLTLKAILAQSKRTDNALYQTVFDLLDKIADFQGLTVEQINEINKSINNILSIVNNNLASKDETYLTELDESLDLPNSRQLLAGTNVTFDDTVVNKRTINVSVPAVVDGYWTPLTDGNVDETDLIFANGEAIAVFVPV